MTVSSSPRPRQPSPTPGLAASQPLDVDSAPYRWFIAGVATWFTAIGMQGVLFSWLIVGVLHAQAKWVGIAQSATMLPSLVLLLLGGAVADRHDRRNLLIGLHLIATLLSVSLVVLVLSDALSLPLLLVYAVGMGSVQAFVMPARDALLSEVAGPNLLRAIGGLTLTQWGTQALGALLAGTARWIGTAPALSLHALLLLSGAPTLSKLPATTSQANHLKRQLRFSEVIEGAREVMRSPVLPPVFLLVAAVGVLFIGPFVVVLPILVRDYYGGNVDQLALLNTAFPLGTIFGSLLILWRGSIQRKGAAQLNTLITGACCLGMISLGLPFWGALTAICGWGIGAAIFTTAGRTMFQEHAPPSHRARVLSVYTFGFMGAAGLLGAPLSGILVERLGPLSTCAFASGTMFIVVTCAFLFTNISHVE